MSGEARHGFDPRVVFGLVAAGSLAFLGFLVLTAYAGDFRSGRDGRAHALSVSAVGFKGLVDLIGYSGGETYLVRAAEDVEHEDLLVVTLDERTEGKALDELLELRGGRVTLVVLPKWLTQPHPLRKAWVTKADLAPPELLGDLASDLLGVEVGQDDGGGRSVQGRGFLEGMAMPAPSVTRTISGEGLETLLEAPGGGAVLGRMPERSSLYILADPDLLNNHGLKSIAVAQGALRLVDELNSPEAESVMFDLTLSGFQEQQSVLKLAFEPPFVALTAALLVAAILAGLHGAVRFGPAPEEERAIALGKAALVDNSAGLLRLARREHRVGGAYADLIRDEAARQSGAPAGAEGKALEAYLDRIGRADGPRFSELAAAARSAPDRNALMKAAAALFSWKKEITQ
ncbi:MAG TPA: hypothetical protein VGR19_04600 [Allosphingosinicella sp.]|nr:hypothetical protein [Allosphingosinicella sp.]